MVYIYEKKIGNKSYYYLRASKRSKNKNITKDIAYLGSSIEEARKNLPIIAKNKDEIKKSYRKINLFLNTEYYKNKIKKMKLKNDDFLGVSLIDVEACKFHFNTVFSKMDELSRKEILENFAIDFAYNTTSIEGNTITLEEARNFFETNKTPANRSLREIYDLQNTKDVLFWLFKKKKELDERLVIEIHKKLMKNIDKRLGFRTLDVHVFKSHFDATPGIYVKTDMELLLKWYEENKKNFHPLVLAIIFHHKFEKIHPFYDGNGRTGRMILNYILIKNNYSPVIIRKKNRDDYLDALGSADKIKLAKVKKDYKKLSEYVAMEMSETYWNLFL